MVNIQKNNDIGYPSNSKLPADFFKVKKCLPKSSVNKTWQ